MCGRVFRARRPRDIPAGNMESPKELQDYPHYLKDRLFCRDWERLRAEWTRAFPSVDILAELRKAHAWQSAKQPKVNQRAFLHRWLAKAQDRARPGDRPETIEQIAKRGWIQELLACKGQQISDRDGLPWEITVGGLASLVNRQVIPWAQIDEQRLQRILKQVKGVK